MMRRFPFFSCCFIVTFLLPVPARAEAGEAPGRAPLQGDTGLTLDEVLERARRIHPLLAAARENIRAAEQEEWTAGRRPNPLFTFSGENFPLGRTMDGFDFGRSLEWYVFLSQPLETAGKRDRRTETMHRAVEVARARLQVLERDLLFQVRLSFERLLLARARLELAEENLREFGEVLRLTQVRVVEGYTAEGDLIKLRLEFQGAEHQVRRLALEYDRARIDLLRAMGESSYELLPEPAGSLDFTALTTSAQELERMAMSRPEVRLAENELNRARAAVELERSRSRPDVLASFGYKRHGPDNTLFGGLSLQLPVFDRSEGRIGRALAEVRVAEAQRRQALNGVRAELAAARRSVAAARLQVEALERDFLSRAEASLQVVLAAHREGAADLLLLLEAYRARYGARTLFLQVLYDYRAAWRELEWAAGLDTLPGNGGAP